MLFEELEALPRLMPDTGTQHLTFSQVYAIAGERFLQHMPKAEQPVWEEIIEAAEDLCPLLGISRNVWHAATSVMGCTAAAGCVLLIDLRYGTGIENMGILPSPALLRFHPSGKHLLCR